MLWSAKTLTRQILIITNEIAMWVETSKTLLTIPLLYVYIYKHNIK